MSTVTTMKLMAGAIALTMGLTAAADAQPGRGGPGAGGPGFRGPGGPGAAMGDLLAVHPDLPLRALNLTDAQREQVRAILDSHRAEAQSLRQRAGAAHQALRAATTSATVDEAAITQQSQAFGGLIAEAAVLRARVRGRPSGANGAAPPEEVRSLERGVRRTAREE